MSFIEIKDAVKTFRRGKAVAVDHLSLSIEKGEIFGLIGPDGAGKTTLFRLLASLLVPDSGSLRVEGIDPVKDYKALRKRIGYMPGRFSLYQDLTVEENLSFFASVFDTTVAANYGLVADIYGQIEPFRKRRAGKLSGGMKQKLALSCALIHAPNVLFLDEPTTGVDPVSRKELWAMLRKLNKERGITIVVSTPYRDEVMQCGRIALLDKGQVVAVGSPGDVMSREEPLRHAVLNQGERYVIEAEGLTKNFGTFCAVDAISLKVREGEIFGFLGANGAGKTTAMRIFCGLSQPSGGRARVAGFDCATQHEQIKRRIGYMSQRFSLYDDLTVEENMKLFGGIYGMKRSAIKRRTAEQLELLGLEAERHTRVGVLPLGWKQRLAFSVSIFHSPSIVFLDEPTGGVDAATRRQFWELIYQTAEQGMTVFVTTHYMDEADYCDRVSIMVDGRIEAMDTPERLRAQFGAESMYDVFLHLARRAKRS